MNIRRPLRLPGAGFPILLSILLCSCGGAGTPPPPPSNPVPSISSVSPSAAAAGTAGLTLTIDGSNFMSTSTLTWNGAQQSVTFVSSSQLATMVSATDLAAAGTIELMVSNPSPGGGKASATFTIAPPAAPSMASVSPATVTVGGSAFTLTVIGTNFVQSSNVQWGGVIQPTTYIDYAHLTASIPSSAITASDAGTLPVTVTTPPPGGGVSNVLPVLVEYPLPSITSLNPSGVLLGSAAFTLTVNGTNFANGATVYLNNVGRVTQFVSPSILTASILASDLTGAAGYLGITVQNPSPSAGISNISQLAVQNSAPILSSVTPSTFLAGNPSEVAIIGSGFLPGATAQVGGQSFSISFTSSTSISSLINVPTGSSALTVTNPPPAVGPSNGVAMSGTPAGPGSQSILASVDSNGKAAVTDNFGGTISSTGRFFVFSNNLRDTCLGAPSGCVPSTVQFESSAGCQWPGCFGFFATGVSSDGRYVLSLTGSHVSTLQLLSPDFVDTCTGIISGCVPAIMPFNVATGFISRNFMTPDARYFTQFDGPVLGQPSNVANIYDTCAGAPPGCSVTAIPVTTQASEGIPMDDSGRFLVYSAGPVFLHDSCLGAAPGCAPSDSPISATGCFHPAISSDALYVAYSCASLNLQATCLNVAPPSCSSAPLSITSAAPTGVPAVSSGGQFVAYGLSNGTISGVPLASDMVFVYRSCTGGNAGCVPQTAPVCLNASGAVASDKCQLGGMSFDGQYVLISTPATNMGSTLGFAGNVSYIVKNPLF